MDAATFSTILREWRHQCGYTDPDAAAALGVATSTFCRWKNNFLPDELIVAGVVHRIRQGDDLAPVCVGAELALKLKDWRARHALNQVEAAYALGLKPHAVRGLERAENEPDALHFIRAREVLRRMEREPDVAAAKLACAPKPPMTPEAFAERLRSWRKARRLTQPRAAAAVSALGMVVGDGTWAKWERCDQTPWPSPMRAVLAALARAPRPAPPAPTSRIRPHREMPMCPRKFCHLLRRWRKGHRLNQAEACAMLGLPDDQALLCNYERGHFIPRPERMRAILAIIASRPAAPPPPRIRTSPFARGLRKWRKFRRLTLARASAILGCSVAMLCKYEHGRNEPPANRRSAILAIIDA
jgi:transcriptional regulator with XRE-family HTH domain